MACDVRSFVDRIQVNPLRYTVDLEASQKADQMDADQKGARRACLLLSVLSLLATFVLTGLSSYVLDGYYVRLPTLLAVVLIWPFSVPLVAGLRFRADTPRVPIGVQCGRCSDRRRGPFGVPPRSEAAFR